MVFFFKNFYSNFEDKTKEKGRESNESCVFDDMTTLDET